MSNYFAHFISHKNNMPFEDKFSTEFCKLHIKPEGLHKNKVPFEDEFIFHSSVNFTSNQKAKNGRVGKSCKGG